MMMNLQIRPFFVLFLRGINATGELLVPFVGQDV
jgi:hypothetical protein